MNTGSDWSLEEWVRREEFGVKRVSVLYITDNGRKLAERLKSCVPEAKIVRYGTGAVPDLWAANDALVFIMATGIVVRAIASLLRDKKTDPAVVVVDEAGRFAVSLVGGHLGGANELARDIAGFLGGEAVITTASDVNGLPSVDLWARDNDLIVEDWDLLPQMGVRLLNNGSLRVYTEIDLPLPGEFVRVAEPDQADMVITAKAALPGGKGRLCLRPRTLVLGIGCNSGTTGDEIEEAVRTTLGEHDLAFASVASLATIDLKGNEPGLRVFAGKYHLPLRTFMPEELNRVEGITKSEAVFQATGSYGVAEPAALLAAGAERLLVQKQKKGNVTVAAAEKKTEVRSRESGERGKIFIVGTGPGSLDHITPAARDAIRKSDVIVGYGTYLDLIQKLIKDKEIVSTGMTREVERAGKAVDLALSGRTVSVISGGDPGVYAMAGLVFEMLRSAEDGKMGRCEVEKKERIETAAPSQLPDLPTSMLSVEVIPGISALNAGASRLGAPLMHDFACISLSDRLTPWEVIEKRLDAAAEADFVIVLYNPRSKGRAGHITRAREIILKHQKPATPVGIVKGAMREHEKVIVTDLANMRDDDIDMQTTVIVGNSKTFVWNHLMVTPRGYDIRESGW
jgi:cobalt-precorrin 5A hydrolase/precorrin-3B C17-methyltransferase